MVEFADDTFDISLANRVIAATFFEAGRVNLVDDSIFRPCLGMVTSCCS